jgi:hypothetical protein
VEETDSWLTSDCRKRVTSSFSHRYFGLQRSYNTRTWYTRRQVPKSINGPRRHSHHRQHRRLSVGSSPELPEGGVVLQGLKTLRNMFLRTTFELIYSPFYTYISTCLCVCVCVCVCVFSVRRPGKSSQTSSTKTPYYCRHYIKQLRFSNKNH